MSYSFNPTPEGSGYAGKEPAVSGLFQVGRVPSLRSGWLEALPHSQAKFKFDRRPDTSLWWLDVPVAMAILDADGKIESVNREAEEVLSCASELLGKRLSDILELDSVFDLPLDQSAQVRLRNCQGDRKVEITLRSRADKRIVTFLDVTERLEVQQLRRDFVAMVGHDLRAPLSLVQVSIEMLSNGLFGELSTEGKLQLAKAERSIDRMVVLLNDLLNLNKLEQTFSIKPQVVEITELIEQAIESTSALASKKDVRVFFESDAGTCFADGARVIQVLVNLIDNAVKFSPRASSVMVRTRRRKSYLEISVQDQGRGVPVAMQSRIFERFVQANRSAGGCGLGLAICKVIVLNHGGKIGVKSRPGKGSRFWFCLPLEKPEKSIRSNKFDRSARVGLNTVAAPLELSEILNDVISFSAGVRSELPMENFQKCLQEAVREFGQRIFVEEPDTFGLKELRERLRQYLLSTRQIECQSDQIVVLPSTEGGLDLLARLLVGERETVVIEDPCFPGIPMSLSRNSAAVIPVSVDREGLSVEELSKLVDVPRLVYVTPSHQDTIGLTMSMRRRLELLSWASAAGSVLVEDDFGCEFSYKKSPLPSLFSLSGADNVIYKYNFWKSLYPLVRISFMVVPKKLVPLFRSATISNDTSNLEHLALALMLERGSYSRYIKMQKRNYARRRRALLLALQKWGSSAIKITPTSSGTHLTVRFHPTLTVSAIEASAKAFGLEIVSTAGCYIRQGPPSNEYLISFARVDEAKVGAQVEQFMSHLQATFR